jgi:hypothetical protein
MASALNAPRRYWAGSEKAQPRLVVSTSRGVGESPDYWNGEDYGAAGGELKSPCCPSSLAVMQASNILDFDALVAA